MIAVSVQNIVKTYDKGKVCALNSINFEVEKGEIFGIIGPDGAGKSSLFRILTTVLLPDSGTATLDGFDVVRDFKAIRERVGYMPGRFSLYQDLSIEENLSFFATVFNTTIEKNYDLIRDIYVQIEPFRKRRAGALSGGMKQKLALCCALIHRPSVLLLDEPTTGVDAVSRKEFWEMLRQLKAHNITILVSTPYMDEASLCDRVALIQEGEILTIAPPLSIASNFEKKLYAVKSNSMFQLLKELRAWEATDSIFPFGEVHHLTLKDDAFATENKILAYLQEKNHTQIIVSQIGATIEDVFMRLMQS
jgi:ABC-type multidrug transport system ATPase subunit